MIPRGAMVRAERVPRPRNNGVLSSRERQLAAGVYAGKSNTAMAAELGLSDGTIKEYINRIYRKLGVHNRTGLAVWWHNRHIMMKAAERETV